MSRDRFRTHIILTSAALWLMAGTSACSRTDDGSVDDPQATVETEGSALEPEEEAAEPEPVEETGTLEERRLAHSVRRALAADTLVRAHHYEVSVETTVVTLTPLLESPPYSTRAAEIAESVEGVSEVVLQVDDAESHDIDATDEPPPAIDEMSFVERFADDIERGVPSDYDRAFELPDSGSGEYQDQLATFYRAASGDRPRTYRVQSGDSLSMIASRTMGDGNLWQELYEHNRSVIGPNPNGLREGMELRIPQN